MAVRFLKPLNCYNPMSIVDSVNSLRELSMVDYNKLTIPDLLGTDLQIAILQGACRQNYRLVELRPLSSWGPRTPV